MQPALAQVTLGVAAPPQQQGDAEDRRQRRADVRDQQQAPLHDHEALVCRRLARVEVVDEGVQVEQLDLARALAARNVELLSTGGTAASLREAGLPVSEVSDVTGFPEMMDGRVKTLHPKVHGACSAGAASTTR